MHGLPPGSQEPPRLNKTAEGSTPVIYYTAQEDYATQLSSGAPPPRPGGGTTTLVAKHRAAECSVAAWAALHQQTPQEAGVAPYASTLPEVLASPYLATSTQSSDVQATAETATLGDGPKMSSCCASFQSTEKRSTTWSFCHSSHAPIAFLELCLAFTVLVMIGVLLLFIFVATGAWPSRHESTATMRIETLAYEHGSFNPFVAVHKSVYSRPNGKSFDSADDHVLTANDFGTGGNNSVKLVR